ncbi:MAG TPA: hypothetical protein VMI56_00975 [Reyranella sp.]|nr:hypothetical protein [Reyranella sp.]
MRVLAPLATALAVAVAAGPASAQLSANARKAFESYQLLAPHRAFFVGGDNGYTWSGAAGADPAAAIEGGRKYCEQQAKSACTLYAVNNVVLNGRDWKAAEPRPAPMIGRLRPEPYWENKGPQAAAGLIVWSHGYMGGKDATTSAPQGEVANFTMAGYDLYRFDRQWIRDWPGDATALVDAVRQARTMGYKRVVLAGQSAGGWVSMAAAYRGAAVDGVISVSAAHHGEVKDMRDVSFAKHEWHQIVAGIKPGPRFFVVNFKDDTYDPGGRMDDAKAAFAASGVDAVIVAYPDGFSGHGAGGTAAFPRKYGSCIHGFIETGARVPPCI